MGANWAESETMGDFAKSTFNLYAKESPPVRAAEETTAPFRMTGESFWTRVGRTASSFVPAGSFFRDVAEAADSKQREAKGIVDPIKKNIPFLRNSLPEEKDAFGKPLDHSRSWMIDPTRATDAKDKTDPVLSELVRLRVGLTRPDKEKGESEEDYRQRSEETGRNLEQRLRSLVAAPVYRKPPEKVDAAQFQKKAIELAQDAAREDAGQGRRPRSGDENIILYNARVSVEVEKLLNEAKEMEYYKKLRPAERDGFEQAIKEQFGGARASLNGEEDTSSRLIDASGRFLELIGGRGEIIRKALSKAKGIKEE